MTTLRKQKSAKGFTLIELLVAATIIIVLSAIGIVSFSSALVNARNGKRKSDMEQARAGLELYRTALGYYPKVQTWAGMMTALYPNYLSTNTLADPKTGNAAYSYTDNSSSGKTYSVCYTPEPAGPQACLANP